MKRYITSSIDQPEIDSEGNVVPRDIAYLLKDSKIRNRKKQLIVCYHGTNSQFTEFKEEFISSNSGNIGWFGRGFYFTNSKKLAQAYGSIQKKCYLNIKRPFVYSSADSIYELIVIGGHPHSYDGRLVPYAYVEDTEPIDNFTKTIKNAGYDGVKFSYRQASYKPNISGVSDAIEFVCFDNSQIVMID